jgi:hypothetical protein
MVPEKNGFQGTIVPGPTLGKLEPMIAKPSTCILVLGNQRTGSSAIAGVLEHLGVDMGGPGRVNRGNPKGYFEDQELEKIHSKILGRSGFRWLPKWLRQRLRRLHQSPKELHSIESSTYEAQYRSMLAQRAEAKLWGVKDPQLCYLLSYLIRSCPDTVGFKFVLATRPFEESVSSIVGRGVLTEARARQVLRGYQEALEKSLLAHKDIDAMEVSYHDLVETPEDMIRQLADFVGVPFSTDAVSFIDPQLRHYRNQ